MRKSQLSRSRWLYDRGMRMLSAACGALVCLLLVFLIGYIFYRGLPHITWELLSTQPSQLRGTVGILPHIASTLYIVLTAMAIVTTWQMAGYMMMIFITGLNNIPGSLYEAADIDGCTAMQRFRHITAPLLLPSFTIVLFLTLANCFKMLDVNVALTEGSFNTRLLAYQILRVTRDFSPPDYGQAQAQAVIFFVLIAGVTLLQVSLTKRREVAL